jgi:hypothetical protein
MNTRTSFTVRMKKYELALEKREAAEGEKYVPYTVTVRVDGSEKNGTVRGTLQFTPAAIEAAQKRSAQKGGSPEDLLAAAAARSLSAEIIVRKLKPDFSFVVDHRWLPD